MGLYDRHYINDNSNYRGHYGSGTRGMGLVFPKPGPAVKWIMIICGAVWFVQLITQNSGSPLSVSFGARAEDWWQVWRYITFQFLHSPLSLWHLALNMLGLYFFGVPLEQRWGTKGFLKFYLVCGCFAGLAYVVMQTLVMPPSLRNSPLIGASGGVFAVLFACAVFYPGIRVLVFFVFPLPIRWLAGIIFAVMIITVIQTFQQREFTSSAFWSHVAHLGGILPSLFWILLLPRLRRAARDAGKSIGRGMWAKKIRKQERWEQEIDRILDKIKAEGIESLSSKEKRMLRKATRQQKEEDRKYDSRL